MRTPLSLEEMAPGVFWQISHAQVLRIRARVAPEGAELGSTGMNNIGRSRRALTLFALARVGGRTDALGTAGAPT